MGRTKTIKIDVGGSEDSDDSKDRKLGPLFALPDDAAARHARTRIYREEPIDEGMLPERISPDADEDTIARKFGGGTYKLEAVDAKGAYIAQRTVKIAGEPKFGSNVSRRRYAMWLKETGLDDPAHPIVVPDAEDARESKHERELKRLRLEADMREQSDERRRAREREERRAEALEREEREEARRVRDREERAAERAAEREQRAEERRERLEFEAHQRGEERALRAQELESKGDPMQQFAVMAQIFGSLTGGAAGDPVSEVIKAAPSIIEQVRETGIAIAASNKGQRPPPRPQVRPEGADTMKLEGPTASKAIAAYKRLQKLGKDPEAIFGQFFEAASRAGAPARASRPAGKPPARTHQARRPLPLAGKSVKRGHANGQRVNVAAGSIKPKAPPPSTPPTAPAAPKADA